MKAILVLVFLFVGGSSFAEEVRTDPNYIEVLNTSMGACGPQTPTGIPCYCNRYVFSNRAIDGWTIFHGFYWIRPGWSFYGSRNDHFCRKEQ